MGSEGAYHKGRYDMDAPLRSIVSHAIKVSVCLFEQVHL